MDRIKSICIEEELCQSHDGSLEQILKQMLYIKFSNNIHEDVASRHVFWHNKQCFGPQGRGSKSPGYSPGIPFPPMLSGAHLSELSIFADESGEWGCCLLLNCFVFLSNPML